MLDEVLLAFLALVMLVAFIAVPPHTARSPVRAPHPVHATPYCPGGMVPRLEHGLAVGCQQPEPVRPSW